MARTFIVTPEEKDLKGAEPVPNGVYLVRVDASEAEFKKGDKGTYFSLAFVIEGHPEHSGRKVYDTFMTEGDGKWKTVLLLKALGFPVVAGQRFVADLDAMHGKMLKIQTKQQADQNGVIRAKVGRMLPADEEVEAVARIPF